MKQLTIIALLLIICASSKAHQLNQLECKDGRVKVIGTDFKDGGKDYVKVTLSNSTWGNGLVDTIVKLSDTYSFTVYVPLSSSQQLVTFRNTNWNGNASGETMQLNVTNCNSLPLKFGKISATKNNDGTATVKVKVYDVENVQRIELRVSIDGKTYKVSGIIHPDEGKTEKEYTAIIKL